MTCMELQRGAEVEFSLKNTKQEGKQPYARRQGIWALLSVFVYHKLQTGA